MKTASKHGGLVELNSSAYVPYTLSVYNLKSAIDQGRLTWGKHK